MVFSENIQIKTEPWLVNKEFMRPQNTIYLVLKGSALISVEGYPEEKELLAGSVVYVPAGLKHKLTIKDDYQAWVFESGTKASEFFVRDKSWALENNMFFDKGSVKIWEFGGCEELDVALATIETHYPLEPSTWAMNKEVDMRYAVIHGMAKIVLNKNGKEESVIVKPKSSLWINRMVPYRVEVIKGPLEVALPSSPAWRPNQYEEF